MKPLSKWITLCGILIFFAACNKESNDSPVAKKLHAGIWQVSGSKIVRIHSSDTVIDLYSKFRPCEQDDIVTFDLNGTVITNEGPDKCPEDNQVGQLTWELLDNDTRLKFMVGEGGQFNSNGTNTSIGEILELTEARLVLKSEESINSVPVTVVETFSNIR
jgi:hypothetical protein